MSESIIDQLRDAVRNSEWSLNAISKSTGIAYPALHRFINHDAHIRLENAAIIAELFGMRLTKAKEPQGLDGQKKS